jgi:hypothetical protein
MRRETAKVTVDIAETVSTTMSVVPGGPLLILYDENGKKIWQP